MNPQIPIEARQTVLDFITAGTSFTAYEVTLEVRRRLGTSIDVPHGAVNGIVQMMFANGEIIGYDRRPDATVQSATPPFRYYQQGGAVAAPFVAPTAPAISRSSLPAALSFINPFGAMIRNLGVAARDFQRANGKSSEPFAVWVATPKEPTFRVRCYGAGWDESEIETRLALDLNNAGNADLLWLSPLAYADEFRLYSNLNGTQTQFLIRMDATLKTSVTKEAARATGEPDGLEIEVAVRGRDFDSGVMALKMYRYLKVAPRIYCGGQTLQTPSVGVIVEGDGWKFPDERASAGSPDSVAIVDEIGYSLRDLKSSQYLGLEIYLKNGNVEPSLEKLIRGDTIAECERVIENFKNEVAPLLNRRLESAGNLWDAKILWGEIIGNDGQNYGLNLLVGNAIAWRGIAIERNSFRWHDAPAGVKVREYLPSSKPNKILDSATVNVVIADPDAVVLINDLGWDKSPTSRVAQLYQTMPFKAAYVLSFENEAARVKFYRDQNFDTVPTRLVSELPRKARPAQARIASQLSVAHPFNAQLYQPKSPASPVMASFANGYGGLDDDFNELKKWARETPLDNNTWPDFKRLYKAIEARLWPPMGRFRWDKTEDDFPAMPIVSERDLELLGVLMGRLDEINASRGTNKTPAPPQQTIAQRALNVVNNLVGRANAATASGPSDDTLAYMKRRATKLLTFLRDNKSLSDERRNALAPLVYGLLQRENCGGINATLPLRLKLDQTDVLANHPDAIARLWADTMLPYNILCWSYEWLENHGQTVAVSPTQLRRFVDWQVVDWTLKLAPAALQSNEPWPQGFGLKEFSRLLQGNSKVPANAVWINTQFLRHRDEIIHLFARFPQLELDKSWLRDSLSQVSDETTLDWLTPWLQERAANDEFVLLEKMSPDLQLRFNAAIVAAHPNGIPLAKWRELSEAPTLLQLLSPTLCALSISSEITDYIWSLPPAERDPVLSALGDNSALLPIIEDHARRLDFAFIAPLSYSQWERFAHTIAATFPNGMSADDWAKIAELPFKTGYELLPLGKGFWQFVLPLESENRAQWIARVGAERASREFANQNAVVFESFLDSDATDLDALGDAWLDAHLSKIALDSELIIKLAQSNISDWQARALNRLSSAELRLPVALRLMESELPILERVAAPFFSKENKNWSDRVLALADSPKLAARALALQLLEKFPARWTPDLLRNLAQHDDADVQAFVAAQLEKAPAKVIESKAIEAFDTAIINARGRARRAKESVKARAGEVKMDRETLLEAARNGAPRDREWALKQLVLASLSGEDVNGLEVAGAFANVSDSR